MCDKDYRNYMIFVDLPLDTATPGCERDVPLLEHAHGF